MFTNAGFNVMELSGGDGFIHSPADRGHQPLRLDLQQCLAHGIEFHVGALVEAFVKQGAKLLWIVGGKLAHIFWK